MGLNVYYPQDIRNALLAAEQATGAALDASSESDDFLAGYRAGYRAALVTFGLAFGLVPTQTQQGGNRDNNTVRRLR